MKNETQTHTSSDSSPRDTESTAAHLTPQERLIIFLETTLAPLGYELVTIEVINQREKVLRVFIDLLTKTEGGVGIEDCVVVTRALDEPLETNTDVEAIFNGPYELEVSSPGIDRPLRKPSDYEKFKAHIARIHTFRPLTASESQAETYTAKNPKQKNYYGIIRGFENESVLLGAVPEDGTLKAKKGKKKIDLTLPLKNETLIRIPVALISKSNLEAILEGEKMNLSELSRVIESVGRDRGIKREIIVSAIEQAILAAAQKKYGPHAILEAHYNDESGEVDLYLFKKVVDSDDDMLEESEEIKVQDALELDPQAAIGDELGVKVETPDFGRIDAQTAKQIIFQKVRDAERDIIFNEYLPLKGEVVSGIARRMERGNLVIDLGKTDALLPKNEIIPGEIYKPGDRVQALLVDVVTTTKGPALYISRTSPKYLIKLLEAEVPEIRDGIIEVKACAREPGSRAKVAVVSKDRDIDPVGACVGMKGVRVQQVRSELKGEKIDIIPWSDNPMVFVKEALAPAEISSIRVEDRAKTMEIMVDDSKLSIAIGKRGQNVRLAAQITGWKLDVISKTKLQKRMTDAVTNLAHIEGLSETMARGLAQSGILNIRQLAEASMEFLARVPGLDEKEVAERFKAKAQSLVDEGAPFVNGVQATVTVGGPSDGSPQPEAQSAHAAADQKLREMIQQSEGESSNDRA